MLISARDTPRGLGPTTAAQPKMATIAARVIHLGIDRDRFTRSGYIGRFQAKNEAHVWLDVPRRRQAARRRLGAQPMDF
jgi:hypothetical protein